MGALTTHVLDTAKGCPGEGIQIQLFAVKGNDRTLLKTAITNDDGRVDAPLLSGDDFQEGEYLLEFSVGDYFRSNSVELTKPAFIDLVPIQFGVSDKDAHYHVPLLVSPYGYSTYRGS